MIHTDEDDEFERIERENAMKGQPYHYKDQSNWVTLTDKELLMAYGWGENELESEYLLNAKVLILEGLRKIEKVLREKNNV